MIHITEPEAQQAGLHERVMLPPGWHVEFHGPDGEFGSDPYWTLEKTMIVTDGRMGYPAEGLMEYLVDDRDVPVEEAFQILAFLTTTKAVS